MDRHGDCTGDGQEVAHAPRVSSHRTHPLPDRLLRVLDPGVPSCPGPEPAVRGASEGASRHSPPPPGRGRGLCRRSLAHAARAAKHAEEVMGLFVAPALEANAAVEVEICEGDPWKEIKAAAERWPADLVVMGTHGGGGLEQLFLGSVTEKLMHHLPCPVLTVCHEEGRTWESPGLVQRILCATDFSEASALAVDQALALAEKDQAKVTVLHVIESVPLPGEPLYRAVPENERLRLELEKWPASGFAGPCPLRSAPAGEPGARGPGPGLRRNPEGGGGRTPRSDRDRGGDSWSPRPHALRLERTPRGSAGDLPGADGAAAAHPEAGPRDHRRPGHDLEPPRADTRASTDRAEPDDVKGGEE